MKSIYPGICALLLNGTAVLAADPHAAPGAPAHWEYTGETGADKWGSLSPDCHVCGTGMMQSPIDLADGFQATGAAFQLNYQPSALNIIHNGHTIQANFQPGSTA